jgi:hypothetical protein
MVNNDLHNNGIIKVSGERFPNQIRNVQRWENRLQVGRPTWTVVEK